MDMIFNHSGFEHPWTKDMPSKDWLNVPEWLTEKESGRDPITGFTANADGSEPAKSAYLHLGIPGLRQAKKSYDPLFMLQNYKLVRRT